MMRRKDRETGKEKAEEILAKGAYGVLSVNGADGPYGVPVCHAVLGGAVYFHCALKGRKVDLLRADDRVSFCVVDHIKPAEDAFSMNYDSAILSGKAAEVLDPAEKLKALEALVLKYYGPGRTSDGRAAAEAGLGRTAVYRIESCGLTGKARRDKE